MRLAALLVLTSLPNLVRADVEAEARHNLGGDQYQKLFDAFTGTGFRPPVFAVYAVGGDARYAAMFIKDGAAALPPATGARVVELDAFDEAVRRFMAERDISAGTLAITRDNKLVFSRGYGWSDRGRTSPLPPTALMRLASVSKPITLAAILKLIREGKLRREDAIVPLLELKALPGQKMDPRWHDVSIEHLIKHQGGWDRKLAFDPMFRPLVIAGDLKRPGPASSRDVIQYMLGQPMQFDPGSRSEYSNFGYCLLGRAVAKASGKSYLDYIRSDLLAPIGVKGITLGRSLVKDRDPAEPVYMDSGSGVNVFDPKGPRVANPDGTFHLEAMDAHGGLVATAPDVARFLDAFWIDGQPRKGEKRSFVFFGSLPGTWTMALQRSDGVNIVALFNRRGESSSYQRIRDIMNTTAAGIKTWPK